MHKQYGFWLILRNAIAASSITLPFVWFVFPIVGSWFSFGWVVYTSVAEIFAFGIEAIFYRFFFPKMNWKHAIVASFICNLLSFGIGLVAEHVI
ncbi:hypothetical protein HZC07_05885 [Candidatus Micrarchaeota archaeon]|nr:hypothetical protein [Candidatus Micrarchaeota archaeon]